MTKKPGCPKTGAEMYRGIRSVTLNWKKQEIIFKLSGWDFNEPEGNLQRGEDTLLNACKKLYQRGARLARFGNEIAWIAYLRNITKQQMADVLHMSLETYELISGGSKMPDLDERILIKAFLDHSQPCALNVTEPKNKHQIQYHIRQAEMLLAEMVRHSSIDMQIAKTDAFFEEIEFG